MAAPPGTRRCGVAAPRRAGHVVGAGASVGREQRPAREGRVRRLRVGLRLEETRVGRGGEQRQLPDGPGARRCARARAPGGGRPGGRLAAGGCAGGKRRRAVEGADGRAGGQRGGRAEGRGAWGMRTVNVVTPETSQVLTGWLNADASAKVDCDRRAGVREAAL